MSTTANFPAIKCHKSARQKLPSIHGAKSAYQKPSYVHLMPRATRRPITERQLSVQSLGRLARVSRRLLPKDHSQEQLRCGIQYRLGIKPVFAVEIKQIAGLTEPIDAQWRHSVPLNASYP